MSKEQTLAWLAGLISTDGTIFKRGKNSGEKHGYRVAIASIEQDWKELILSKVRQELGLDGGYIDRRKVVISGIRKLIEQISAPEYEQYFSPRKWKYVQNAKQYYDSIFPRWKDGLIRCWRCAQYLPKDMFNRNKADIYGVTSCCKQCRREIYLNKTPNKKRKLVTRKKDDAYHCPRCKRYLSRNMFWRSATTKYNVSIYCIECSKAYYKNLRQEKRTVIINPPIMGVQ